MKARLGQMVDIQIGYQVTGRVVPRPGDTHLLVQTGDVSENGEINWANLSSFTPERRGTERYTLMDGDVLFLAKGAKRVAAVVRNPLPKAIAVSTFYLLRRRYDPAILPEYLAWFLNKAAWRDIASRELKGTTMVFVSKTALAGLEIEVPSPARQRQIAALDALVRREKALAVNLLEKRARLVHATARRAVMHGEDEQR
ncbi:MAG: hypothetical protein ACM3X4_13985 [Ignavibacteriales bacterium]